MTQTVSCHENGDRNMDFDIDIYSDLLNGNDLNEQSKHDPITLDASIY